MSYPVVLFLGDNPVAVGSAEELPDVTQEMTGAGRLAPIRFTVNIAFHEDGLTVLGNPSNLGAALGGNSFTCEFTGPGDVVWRANNCTHGITDALILAEPADLPAEIHFIATDVSEG
jgi:hypothetical protein